MKQRQRCLKGTIRNLLSGKESGIILIAVIMFVAVLALLGAVSVLTISTDIKISSNYKSSKKSFYSATAGIEEAKIRLRGGSTGSPNQNYVGDKTKKNATWCAYIMTSNVFGSLSTLDPEYNFGYDRHYPIVGTHDNDIPGNMTNGINSIQTTQNMSYVVKIRHKREYDAELAGHIANGADDTIIDGNELYLDGDNDLTSYLASGANSVSLVDRGNIIYYGFPNPEDFSTPVQFTAAPGDPNDHYPVEIITALGDNLGSQNIIMEEVVINPGMPLLGAIYTKTTVAFKGAASEVDGNNQCATPSADASSKLPTIYRYPDPSLTHTFAGKSDPTVTVPPTPPVNGDNDVTVQDYINILKRGATTIINDNASDVGYWGAADDFQTFYYDKGVGNTLTLSGSTPAYGVLLVEGDFHISGGWQWNGIVICTGSVTLTGGGSGTTIQGALVANHVETATGTVKILYDSCNVDDALRSGSVNEILWREIY